MPTKKCRDCPRTDLVPRGKYFRNQCYGCWAKTQRENRKKNHAREIARSRANYQKHATKRRQESAVRKAGNREYYSLAEWFRKKGIPMRHVAKSDVLSLVAMKQAVRLSKLATQLASHELGR